MLYREVSATGLGQSGATELEQSGATGLERTEAYSMQCFSGLYAQHSAEELPLKVYSGSGLAKTLFQLSCSLCQCCAALLFPYDKLIAYVCASSCFIHKSVQTFQYATLLDSDC